MSSLGHLNTITIELNQPFKLNIPEMQHRELMVLIGKNGTGKTFVLKLVWVVTMQLYMKLIAKKIGVPYNDKENLQFLMDHSFTDNNMDGKLKFMYGVGDIINITMENGKVADVTYLLDENLTEGTMPIFMSKETRLFSDIVRYLKFRKTLGIDPGVLNEADTLKLLELYRIYDIMYMEQLLQNIEQNTTPKLIELFNKHMHGFDEHFILETLRVDYKAGMIYIKQKDKPEEHIDKLGAGHQSLVNVILANSYRAA
jgi:predicted ATP-binding protein involved in virulence